MSKFTSGEWNVTDRTFSLDGQSADWYLVYSPEQAVGFIRDEADAKLIAAAPELYKMLKEELIPSSDYGGLLSLSRESKVSKLLARIDKEDAEHEFVHTYE